MKRQDVLLILIPTLIVIVAWIGFNIYDNAVTSTISTQEAIQITPIAPTFNTKILDELKTREMVEPEFKASSNLIPGKVTIPTPTPATQSAKLSTQSATINGGKK